MADILFLKECLAWPDCSCCIQLSLWARELENQDRVWDLEELAIGEMMIFVNLACVSSRCPDKRTRQYAKRQLRKPFWDRQKRLGIWVEH
jgi:hypothetical protein